MKNTINALLESQHLLLVITVCWFSGHVRAGDNFIYKKGLGDMTVNKNTVSCPVFTTKPTVAYMKALEPFWC